MKQEAQWGRAKWAPQAFPPYAWLIYVRPPRGAKGVEARIPRQQSWECQSLTFGRHDSTILARSVLTDIALPVLLLVHIPIVFGEADPTVMARRWSGPASAVDHRGQRSKLVLSHERPACDCGRMANHADCGRVVAVPHPTLSPDSALARFWAGHGACAPAPMGRLSVRCW